jgi:hypothetical protein
MVDSRLRRKTPSDIVNATDMTQAQKIEAPDNWALGTALGIDG